MEAFLKWLLQPGGLASGQVSAYMPGGSEFNRAGMEHLIRTAIQNLNYASDPTAALQFYTKLKAAGGLVASDNPTVWAQGKGGNTEDVVKAAAGRFLANPGAGTDPTTAGYHGQKLNNVPGRPEVWKMGNTHYLVYMVPGTEADPVYMAWAAPSIEDVQSWFGPDKPIVVNRTLTGAQWNQMGVLKFGSTDEIPPGAENPFAGWAETLRYEKLSQPWIMDADYQRLMAMARVEGRALTDAEIASTKWWRTHSASERRWMITYHGDPETAGQQVSDAKMRVKAMLQEAGGGLAINQAIIDYIATEFVQGRWSEAYLANQIRAVTDKSSGIAIDPGLAKKNLSSVGQTSEGEDVVRDLLSTWLGPAFGNWSEAEIKRRAGQLRNDPDAQQALVEELKKQRLALFPEYTDPNTSYAAIANTWKQWWLGQWGEMPDEKENLFIDVLKRNDLTESAKILRKEGLARGIGKVVQDLSQAGISLGGSERNPVNIG